MCHIETQRPEDGNCHKIAVTFGIFVPKPKFSLVGALTWSEGLYIIYGWGSKHLAGIRLVFIVGKSVQHSRVKHGKVDGGVLKNVVTPLECGELCHSL